MSSRLVPRRTVLLRVALASAVPAGAVAATTPAVESVLAGGVGDGGPAAKALVNAGGMYRAPAGDLWVFDTAALSWRAVATSTGRIARVTDKRATVPTTLLAGRPVLEAVMTPTASYYRTATALLRVDATGTAETLRDTTFSAVLAVGPDGSILIGVSPTDSVSPGSTQLWRPGTGWATVLPRQSHIGALAADGTAFVASRTDAGDTIERIKPDGSVDTVAGPPAEGPAGSADGVPATAAFLRVDRLTASADGSRLVYRQGRLLRSFTIGGTVATVAGADEGNAPCDAAHNPVLAEPGALLVGCGGVRSYAYDGSRRPWAGTVVAGLNNASGWADSPSGTPLARAFLGRVQDVATNPRTGRVAMVTRWGAYEVQGTGSDAKLVRLLSTGLSPSAAEPFADYNGEPAYKSGTSVDADYGPDGTLYLAASISDGNGGIAYPQIIARSPSGTVTKIAGAYGYGSDPAEGVVAKQALLRDMHLAAGPGVLYFSDNLWGRLWRIDLGTGLIHFVGGKSAGDAPAAGAPAATTRFTWVEWLGVDPASGQALVASGSLYRIGADGKLQIVSDLDAEPHAIGPSGDMSSWAVRSDGSVYGASVWGQAIWRQSAGGAESVVAGKAPGARAAAAGSPALSTVTIAAGPAGSLAIVDGRTPSAYVAILRPVRASASAPATLTTGGTATVTGLVTALDGRTALGGEKVTLQARPAGGTTWSSAGTVVSGPDGRVARSYKPSRSTEFRWVQGSRADALVSPTVLTAVKPTVSISAPTSVRLGGTVTVSGVVKPAVAGRPVSVQRYVSGAWKTAATGKISATGKVAIKVEPAKTGSYVYRLLLPEATDLAEATSSSRTVKVVR